LLFSRGIVVNTASDLIVWHSAAAGDNAGGTAGGGGETQLYQYVSPNVTDTVPAKQINSASWVTHAAPVVMVDRLFFHATDGNVRGWTDGRHFDLTPNFQVAVSGGSASSAAPLYNTGNGLLYVTANVSFISAVSIEPAKVQWELRITSTGGSTAPAINTARPVLSPDLQRLYVGIGSELYVIDAALTGGTAQFWDKPFVNEDGSLIVADPAVSHDGRYVYYVGVQEQIVTALKVARSLAPTTAPSVRPSLAPSISHQPSAKKVSRAPQPARGNIVTPAGNNDVTKQKKSMADNVPLLAGSIVGGLVGLLLIGGLVYYYLRKRGGGGGGDDGIDPNYRYE
jgi:hypothetical protein